MKALNKIKAGSISFVIAVFLGAFAFVIIYNLACIISPPYFIDDSTGQKYSTMPIGHVLISSIVSIIIGILALVICYRRFINT